MLTVPGAGAEGTLWTFSVEHVAVVTRDIDAALPFFGEGLGLALEGREMVLERGVGLASRSVVGTTIQLVRPAPPGPLWEHLERRREGLHHVRLAVAEIGAAVERLAPAVERLAPAVAVAVDRGGLGGGRAFRRGRPAGSGSN